MTKIKLLIVDDSAFVRHALKSIFETDSEIEIVGIAADPYQAAQIMKIKAPDVITLDIEMPKMDGLTFLKKIMSQHPIPVIIISSLTASGSETALKALEYGAIEIITKPQLNTKEFFEESRIRLCDIVKAAASAKHRTIRNLKEYHKEVQTSPKYTADVVLTSNANNKSMIETTEKVVVIGASTGGTEAIKEFLTALPANSPGIVIVQHMPEVFTRSFAKRMNDICKISVKEADNNDSVIRGLALIAPGNKHTLIKRSGAKYITEIVDGPLVNRHRPSVDVLFRSAARYAGKNAIGIILTGMGKDGVAGLLEMKEAGAKTVAQDESSSVVFGMPKEAIKINAALDVLPLNKIAEYVLKYQYS
ncbi:MAG: chemotaxis response regulator protein-glutamate methylesterase [Bacteroidetes bacterium]|nr:chemotaxis response regulator protein-glutamate methylesterase [Bacteroidota bacterium]